MSQRVDAAVLLIGNELLSGRVRDENLPFLAKELWQLGILLRTTWVIRDDLETISTSVRALSDQHSMVFTTGGIGPTHDDLTVEAIAAAFGVPLVQSEQLAELIRTHVGGEATEHQLRMARIPQGADLVGAEGTWPTIRMKNTYVLPGVPSILRRKFENLRSEFPSSPWHRDALTFICRETEIAPMLDAVVASFDDVEIGSYPQSEQVLITFEGQDPDRIRAAREALDQAATSIPRPESSN